MFRYRYGKRVWMTLVALFMLMACATGETPPQPTRIVQAQEQTSGMVKINSTVTYQLGNLRIVATVYDNPETEENVDLICQSVIDYQAVSVNCQRMN